MHELDLSPSSLVLVNRAWQRNGSGVEYQVFPVELREWLPCIPVPLKQGEAEVPLDLQFLFNRVCDTRPYRCGAVDYSKLPPDPALEVWDAAWATELPRAWRGPAPDGSGS